MRGKTGEKEAIKDVKRKPFGQGVEKTGWPGRHG
jgi:hypothetical protein